VVRGVGIKGTAEFNGALKGAKEQVLARNDRLYWLQYSLLLASGQLAINGVLKVAEKVVLLRRFNIVNNIN
jgi:hypothetical protein